MMKKQCGCSTTWYELCEKFHHHAGNTFEKWGRFVYKRALLVMVASLVISFALMAGFLKFSVYGQAERLFYPQHSLTFKNLDRVQSSFNYYIQNEEFILVRDDGSNLLDEDTFKMAHEMHMGILKIKGFDGYCLQNSRNSCVSVNPFDVVFPQLNFTDASQHLFAILQNNKIVMSNGLSPQRNFPMVFGEFFVNPAERKLTSSVLRVLYPVHFSQTRSKYEKNSEIEMRIIDYLKKWKRKLSSQGIILAYNTVRGLDDSISQNTKDNMNLIAASIFSMVLFCTICMVNCRAKFKSHVLLSLAGILAVTFGIGAGFGLVLLLGKPYVGFIGVLPFLVLGIGIDDMFIILHHLDLVPMEIHNGADRLGLALREAGLTILMTTVTDLVAFIIGTVSMFPAVKLFCTFAFFSILFAFLMILTFFLAFVSFDIKRIHGNRSDCLPCIKVKGEESYKDIEEEKSFTKKGMEMYANFLMNKFVKIGVVVFAALLLIMGIYGTVRTSLNFNYKVSGSSRSSYIHWIQTLEAHFPFGVFQMDVVLDDPSVDYTDPKVHDVFKELDTLPSRISELDANKTINWMSVYIDWAQAQNLTISSQGFYANLPRFLGEFKDFAVDLVFSESGTTLIASRVHFFTKDRASWLFRKDALVHLRKACDNLQLPFYPVSFTFVYLSHLIVIIKATLTNVVVCSVTILMLTLPFVVRPQVSILLLLTFVSFLIELLGLMYLWDLSLNSITMIVILMAVGFAVDYSCHIVHAYLVSKETDPDSKMKDAISNIGATVLKGATSTLLGVVVLSISSSKLFRLFFKMMFSIILLGLIHGLIILPVILTWFVKSNRIGGSGLQQSDLYSIKRNEKSRDSRKKLLVNGETEGNVEIAENTT